MTTQDTRKDPRAKVLTMTVRYKSATLDEFIEHHSYDVSRGGMFIKTPSPFPPGTLLKFEVKIASEQRVMQGVGRVVWKREAAEAGEHRPAGMGVKFIKIDDESRKVIDQLIEARGDTASNFESGTTEGPPARRPSGPPRPDVTPTPAAPPAAAVTNMPHRKSTMIGLGAMTAPAEAPPKEESAAGFFPESALEMPAPEDRTVMKQAAELLQEALREAGGSLEDLGTPAAPPSSAATKVAPAAPLPAAAPVTSESSLPKVVITEAPDSGKESITDSPSTRLVLEPRSTSARARMAVTQPATPKPVMPVKPAQAGSAASASPARTESQRPRAAVREEPARASADAGGGGAKVMLVVVAAAAAAVIVYFATRVPEHAAEPPAIPAAETPPPAAEPIPEPVPQVPPPEPPAAVPDEPAPPAAATDPEPPPAVAVPAPREPVVAPPKPEPAARPAPVQRPRPVVRPKPVEPSDEKPTEAPAPATPPVVDAPTEPTAKPVAPKPVPAPKPGPAPKPDVAPKPAPTPPSDGDNPY